MPDANSTENQTQIHEHRYPDGLPMGPAEYVRVEMTTKGPKWEIKASNPTRLGVMFKELKTELAKFGMKME